MLTEDAVIRALCEHLAASGWQIVSWAAPDQHGTDLVALREGTRLEVEAKGAGSSKPHTARYGQPFTTAQVKVHVGEAVLKALRSWPPGQRTQQSPFPTLPATAPRPGPSSRSCAASALRSIGSPRTVRSRPSTCRHSGLTLRTHATYRDGKARSHPGYDGQESPD